MQETEGRRPVGRSGGRLARLGRILRRIVGAPDYAAYLEHCHAAGHEPRLMEQEYVREFFEHKGKAPRCC